MEQVSVIVATYRRDVELNNALMSLGTQSYTEVEILLIDDNGDVEWNKRVARIVDVFKDKYPKIPLIYIVNETNQGSAKTRNIGIEKANGKYVTFLDDDDIYLTEKIKKQAAFMKENRCDYSITDLLLYNKEGKLVDKRIRSYIKDVSKTALQKYHLKYHLTGTDTMMFTKEYLLKIGCFTTIDVGDEFYLMQKAIEGGGKFGYLPECDVKAYIHTGDGGVSSGDGKIKGENALYAYKQQFFNQINRRTRRYIKMRHYAVLAFAEKRRGKIMPFLKYALMATMVAPIAAIKLMISR